MIGFDDVAQAEFSIPSLTTMRQPMAEMGAISAGIVKEAIEAGELKRSIPVVRRKFTRREAPTLFFERFRRWLRTI